MLLTILLTVVATLSVLALGWFGHAWWIRHRTPVEVKADGRQCDWPGCDVLLPKAALRTHDGRWRCARHKGQAA